VNAAQVTRDDVTNNNLSMLRSVQESAKLNQDVTPIRLDLQFRQGVLGVCFLSQPLNGLPNLWQRNGVAPAKCRQDVGFDQVDKAEAIQPAGNGRLDDRGVATGGLARMHPSQCPGTQGMRIGAGVARHLPKRIKRLKANICGSWGCGADGAPPDRQT